MVCFLLSIFMLSGALTVAAQPELLHHLCLENGNFTANSTYQANRHSLLKSIYSNTKIDYGFYNFSYGENNDKVHAIALCRPDFSPDSCRDCINYSSTAITALCPNEKEAIIIFENCSLRYTYRPIFGVMEVSPNFSQYNLNFVSDVNGFNKNLYILLDKLREGASKGNSSLKYAAGEQSASESQTIYAVLQCTPDLSATECSSCLFNASGIISQCCEARQGGSIFLPSCKLRYEINRFYEPSSSPSVKGKQRVVIITSVSAVLFLIITFCSILLRLKKPEKRVQGEIIDGMIDESSLLFDFETIRLATNDFSEANELGKGGFGTVYKGTFPNGQDIAVKRLSRNSAQGELEFKNEVMLVAKLKHKNLVRLLGFCLHQEERLLVYEFLPNSSLDNFIFNRTKRLQLDWEKRYNIIRGIAKGLLYLHEDSRFRIIHRDLKTSNILLDADMEPKISDFGMARMFAGDQTQDSTTKVAGTFGYMPPEYVKHGQFSIKSDVFSFGVLVLETLSGSKRSFQNGEYAEDLLTHARERWNQGTTLDLIDPTLSSVGSRNEMMKCIYIALLCVQEKVTDRPTMASVVMMLSNHSSTLPELQKPEIVMHAPRWSDDQADNIPSKNEYSTSELYPR